MSFEQTIEALSCNSIACFHTMKVFIAWSLCHQLGTTHNSSRSSTLVILEFYDSTSFTGEISDDDTSFGSFRARVSGTLEGKKIRWQQAACANHSWYCNTQWQLAALDVKGKLFMMTVKKLCGRFQLDTRERRRTASNGELIDLKIRDILASP